jgi:DNA mismatch repair protein MutS2
LSVSNYPVNIEEKLGFDKIKSFIAAECHTEAGRKSIESMRFFRDYKQVHQSLLQIAELNQLLSESFVFEFPEDTELVNDLLHQSDKEGMWLQEDELFVVMLAMRCYQTNIDIIRKKGTSVPHLYEQQSHLIELKSAAELISGILDKEGKIKPDASSALWDISKKIDKKEKEVRKLLQSKFEQAKKNGWAGDTEITIRNERLVIPIIAEHKKKMPGFVHDDSQSGKFLYIEPIECFEENNALKELYFERKKEIEQILKHVTAQLAPYKQPVFKHAQFCVFLDTCRAKAIFGSKLRACEPQYTQHHDETHLIKARHPLLYLHLIKDNKELVPLNLQLKKGNRLILISGPNAGGKSIALKTVGLLQYMYQCGLPIPLDPDSKLSVYQSIFIDIGDNQSLENNLSSYSSHLVNMKFFMEHANKNCLYLIDELGNGTDPSIGSSIAQSILEHMLSKEAIGVVTTHFGNLKAWAGQTDHVRNARMLYDLQKLEPKFVLELDKPGSSFAIEVASKVGIDEKIIQRVRKINQWKQHIDLDELLAENEKNRLELTDMKKRVEDREKVLDKMIADYETLKQSLSENKNQIINEAKKKASGILDTANQKIEQTIKGIQENKAEKAKTKLLRQDLDKFKKSVEPEQIPMKQEKAPEKEKRQEQVLKVGSIVKHHQHKVSGEILKIKKDQAQVLFGQVTMWLPLSELYSSVPDKKHQPKTATFNARLFEKQSNFRAELDLRGVRGEEAIQQLENWLHDAHLLGMFTLKIVHGRGHGILRKLIIEHLKSTPFVVSFEHETEQLGGDGVTLVKIK